MKRFLRDTLLFLLLPVVVVLLFDLYLRNMETQYSAKYDGLMKMKKEVEVLFVGNSHAHYAISPLHITRLKAYNLAMVSQQLYFDKRLTIKAINEGVSNLRYLFISVDYHSLHTSSQDERNIWSYYANGIRYKDQDYTKAILSPFIWGYTPRVSYTMARRALKRRVKYGGKAVPFHVERGVNVTDSLFQGFLGLEGTKVSTFKPSEYRKIASKFREDTTSGERAEVLSDLHQFIRFLKEKDIQPILFSSPTYREYNQTLDSAQIRRNLEDIRSICETHNIPYWPYNDDARFTREDFFNPDHLNKQGAAKFSRILDERLGEWSEVSDQQSRR